MTLTLTSLRAVDAAGDQPETAIVIDGERIAAVGRDVEPRGTVLDGHDFVAFPGFLDVHTHGGGGFALHTTDPEEILAYARWAPSTGTTAFLIGVVGVPGRLPLEQLRAAVAAIERAGPGAEMLGIHLEGPYINPARRGAHPVDWLRGPDPEETEEILAVCRGHLKLVTLAPELPGAGEMIRRLIEAGVTVSIGHTDASYEGAREAIGLGISHATHCFNAMPPLLHRAPGPLAAIIEAEQVLGELIGDGVHVEPPAMRALLRALGPERAVVVTDAQPGAGLADAEFDFAGQPARVVGGAARLLDGTIAGSVLTMDQAVRNLREMVGIPLREAVTILSLNPARSAGIAERKGRLAAGYDADLVLFDGALTLQASYCRGRLCFAGSAWQQRLDASS